MSLFYRLSGGGNDFLALAEPERAPSSERIRAWCRRGLSLGADGLFVLRRQPEGVEMEYWNADGLPAELCLNGTRCAARLAFALGWAQGQVEIVTGAGILAATELDGTRVRLEIPLPESPPQELTLDLDDGRRVVAWLAVVGVPHLVIPFAEDLERAPVATLSPALRRHPDLGPEGANVDFARYEAPHRLALRTYERGIEGETLACGTGVLAATAVGLHLGQTRLPVQVLTRGGFLLEVAGTRSADGRLTGWSLGGDARLLARGEVFADAEAVPDALLSSPSR